MAEYKDTRKHKEPKSIINVPLNWPDAGLSKEQKTLRFCQDEEGNLWALPIVSFKYDSSTKKVEPNPNLTLAQIIPTHQDDAVLAQAAPAQNTWYLVLDTTNAIIYSMVNYVATTGETIEVRLIIDGVTYDGGTVAQGADAMHWWIKDGRYPAMTAGAANVLLNFAAGYTALYGRSVKIYIRKTSAAGVGTINARVTWGRFVP
jgi:hypothetical protein